MPAFSDTHKGQVCTTSVVLTLISRLPLLDLQGEPVPLAQKVKALPGLQQGSVAYMADALTIESYLPNECLVFNSVLIFGSYDIYEAYRGTGNTVVSRFTRTC